jgi:SNF2 family DNA or RNA helicase
LDIIENKPNGKFILFSNYDETFSFIRHALYDDGIHFTEISGTMESREKKIHEFKKGNINVLFINSIANGAGINLQEATDIILYHRMADDVQAQIIGRAYRIGREEALHVHHLL